MNNSSDNVLRFQTSERVPHWAIAVPFITCYFTALVLIIYYNNTPDRPYHDLFAWTHRISGISLFILPLIVLLSNLHDFKVFSYNIKQAWSWSKRDFKWLLFMCLSVVSKKVSLPEQGKFNAAEKMNFMTLMFTYPVYIITGIFIWITDSSLLPWLVHFIIAIISTPLMFGHMFMAMINPKTRIALSGMISGFVDKEYVKDHHALWYREQFESIKNPEIQEPSTSNAEPAPTSSPGI